MIGNTESLRPLERFSILLFVQTRRIWLLLVSVHCIEAVAQYFVSCIFAIENSSSLFQSKALCLDDVEIEENAFDSEPATIYDVVFPGNMHESNRVDVLIENQS